jgi:endonuclease/exonuclease/phosphatase family metal-dependent hydrolase
LTPLGKVKAKAVRLTKSYPVRFLILLFTCFILGIVTWILLDLIPRPSDEGWVMPTESEGNTYAGVTADGFTVLSANVGNLDLRCLPYYMKLCRGDVESRISKNIQELQPDVVAIQETLPDWMCDSWPVAVPGSICTTQAEEPQIRRLLGPDYTIVCEARNGFECIAVHVDAGQILGCESGELCETDRLDRQGEGCRWNVAIMAATVRVRGQTFDVVNAHPERRSAACRLASIRQIFENTGEPDSLVREEKVLVLGDLNLDPWREDDVSSRYWRAQVGRAAGSEYAYHSEIAEHQPPYPTLRYLSYARTYDHVVSNFLNGTTQVLGESPGTARLDGGHGMDHRAVYGFLSWHPAAK